MTCSFLLYPGVLLTVLVVLSLGVLPVEVDPNGYILYCPCMGRFGNQADHFLGSLAFARSLNRTLALPAWVEFRNHAPRSTQIPFDTYFQVAPLQEYHRVITMEKFMKELAPEIWPPGERTVFCYSKRGNSGCDAKQGNPFGPFWDTYEVDFDHSELYGPLYFAPHSQFETKRWLDKYPPDKYPVMAFTGAPAQFPVNPADAPLQKYLKWSKNIEAKATKFIKENVEKPFIGLHLRNGIDWRNACDHVEQSPQMFASPQCLGQRGENGPMTYELCFPSDKTIIRQVKEAVKKYKAKTVFVATDQRDMMTELGDAFKKKVKLVKFTPSDPHVDLAILGKADFFLGNCVSTFTAFAKRERDVNDLPSGFWAFPTKSKKKTKEEL
ncbi:GDP-fucose protein O-fucosyltransferase 1-like [Liolophura sinensis]|uniref:GDP-fucose protein O-fucosyltransferase 1-like n=1 Tax=Liolophura sinensis TaxID=3198878 RepID=UPI0031597C91